MTASQKDALMDIAQELLVKGESQEDITAKIAESWNLDTDTTARLVAETAAHPITKILVARA